MGILLLVPFFLLRFGLMALLDKGAVGRAAHFAPMEGRERVALYVYQLANLAIFICPLFLRVQTLPRSLFFAGLGVYLTGLLLLAASVVGFARGAGGGVRQTGLYRFSRNPMYVAYFVFFAGCALLTQSVPLGCLLLVFELSTHWIILAEERWCAGSSARNM